jgi:hypothetical protein
MARRDCIVGGGNVFEDLGHPRPAEALAKTELARTIVELIAKKTLAAGCCGRAAERRSAESVSVSRATRQFLTRPARSVSSATWQRR